MPPNYLRIGIYLSLPTAVESFPFSPNLLSPTCDAADTTLFLRNALLSNFTQNDLVPNYLEPGCEKVCGNVTFSFFSLLFLISALMPIRLFHLESLDSRSSSHSLSTRKFRGFFPKDHQIKSY